VNLAFVKHAPPACPLCGETFKCDCTNRRGPFHLTFVRDGTSGGNFVTVDLALRCLKFLETAERQLGKVTLFDRHGLPVKPAGLENRFPA
jgi:hypothetical protein